MREATSKPVVYILDKSYPTRYTLKRLLETHGMYVEAMESPIQFLALLSRFDRPGQARTRRPVLFIIGLTLRDTSGLDLVKELKGYVGWRQTPVIVISSEANRDVLLEAVTCGVTDFVVKPVHDSDLLCRIYAAIGPELMAPDENLPVISHNLLDILSREVSRARRTSTPVSVMMVNFSLRDQSSDEETGRPLPPLDWPPDALDRLRRSLREIDTVVPFGIGTFTFLLPLTSKENIHVVEERVRNVAAAVLDGIARQSGQMVEFLSVSATFPGDAADAHGLLACVRQRLAPASRLGAATTPDGQDHLVA